MARFGRRAPWWQGLGPQHPAQVLALAFAAAIGVGALLLMLPVSVAGAGTGGAPFLAALFTATSAVCVTGLIVVDTATYWSGFGQSVIIVLIQLGGLGIMTAASLIAILLARRLGLRSKFIASASVRTVGIGDVRQVVTGVARLTFAVEAVITLMLAARLVLGYGLSPGAALLRGAFTAVSGFNNAGFALWSDNLISFGTDPWMLLPVCAAVIIGGLGFPVLFEIRRHLHPRLRRRWSMHTSLVLIGTGVLLLGGTAALTGLEWDNPATLGPLPPGQKVLAGFVAATMTRTAGFNAVDIGAMTTQSLFTQDLLMFVGGGPAGTAGGVKITTVAVLAFVIATVWAKALTDAHGQILDQLGVHHVVHPELEMGRRTAHLLRGALADYENIGGGFAMVTASVPRSLQDRRVADLRAQRRGEINIVAIRHGNGPWEHTSADTVLTSDATVIVIGPAEQAEHFIDL